MNELTMVGITLEMFSSDVLEILHRAYSACLLSDWCSAARVNSLGLNSWIKVVTVKSGRLKTVLILYIKRKRSIRKS